jgi:hypothetical protein
LHAQHTSLCLQPADTSFANVVTDGVHAKDRLSFAAAVGSGAPAVLSPEQSSEGLKRLKPLLARCLIDSMGMDQCLIFCRTNVDCDSLEAYFTAVSAIHTCNFAASFYALYETLFVYAPFRKAAVRAFVLAWRREKKIAIRVLCSVVCGRWMSAAAISRLAAFELGHISNAVKTLSFLSLL